MRIFFNLSSMPPYCDLGSTAIHMNLNLKYAAPLQVRLDSGTMNSHR